MNRIRLFFLWLLAGALLIPACKDKPLQPVLSSPDILRIYLPEKAYLEAPDGILVQAVVDDPQGLQDIVSVISRIHDPQGNITNLEMRDDGLDGDIISGDGQFVVRVSGSVWKTVGKGSVTILVEDAEGNSRASEAFEVEILPGSPGATPVISELTFPDTVNQEGAAMLSLAVNVSDADGLANLDSVAFAVYPPRWAVPSLHGLLRDDGQMDDGIAGNGRFGAQFQANAFAAGTGHYTIQARAFDRQGNRSNALLKFFYVISSIENLPPVVESVTAPDTLSRNRSEPLVLRARVSDPNGLADISRVFFNVFRPDGSASSSNPNFMRDDGVRDQNGFGDTTANDGEYALAIIITADTPTGTYRFEFQAQDRAGLLSPKLVHTITVVQ